MMRRLTHGTSTRMQGPARRSAAPTSHLLCACVLTALLSACERGSSPDVTPAQVSSSQFQQLRWLEGDWRGSGGGVDAFYERYRWVDDSTIRKYDFSDSTLRVVTDSGEIVRRGSTVRSESPARSYVVVALDSASVRFAPERNATNGFEWRRTAPGAWTARLTWDSAGVARERMYEMRAHTPPTGVSVRASRSPRRGSTTSG